MINRNDYFTAYKKKNYKRIPLDVSLSKYDEIKAAAQDAGESVNGYIKKAIDIRLNNEVTSSEDSSV